MARSRRLPLKITPAPAALDQAFTRLETFDWGQGYGTLQAIEDALLATRNDPVPRRELEQRLAACLASAAPVAAKQYVCRKLSLIGTEASVPALAAQLGNRELSHLARLALDRIPGAAANEALRAELPRVEDSLKVGIIHSLGARGDAQTVGVLTDLLQHASSAVAGAAATALGHIGTAEAARALGAFQGTAPPPLRPIVTDAWLAAAEQLAPRPTDRGDGDLPATVQQRR